MKKVLNLKINPRRDWKFVLGIFLLGLVIISALAWKVYLSSQIADGYFNEYVSGNPQDVKDINLKKLQSGISILKNRQTPLVKVIDPSL